MLGACSLKLPKYRRVGFSNWFGSRGAWIMAPAPAGAVFKKIH